MLHTYTPFSLLRFLLLIVILIKIWLVGDPLLFHKHIFIFLNRSFNQFAILIEISSIKGKPNESFEMTIQIFNIKRNNFITIPEPLAKNNTFLL